MINIHGIPEYLILYMYNPCHLRGSIEYSAVIEFYEEKKLVWE